MKTIKISGGIDSPEYQLALGIRRRVFIEEQKVPENLEIDEFENVCDYFLTLKDGLPLATGRLRKKDSFIKFERIATIPEARGKGVGRSLMLFMMNEASLSYPTLIPYMHSQLEAAPFYEKLGWKREGEIFYEANIPHIRMRYEKP